MDAEKRLNLITRNTAEVLTEEDLKKILISKKQLSAYLGIATTGPFHMGYLIPLGKLFDFGKAGIKIIALANSDSNIRSVDYPIVANDASTSSIEFFTKAIASSYKEGLSAKPE